MLDAKPAAARGSLFETGLGETKYFRSYRGSVEKADVCKGMPVRADLLERGKGMERSLPTIGLLDGRFTQKHPRKDKATVV